MPMSRAPRQLLTGWVANPRPIGSLLMTRGRTLKKALVRCGQSLDFAVWRKVAANRGEWRKLWGQKTPLPRPKPTAYAEQVHDIFYGPPPPDAPHPIAPIANLPAPPPLPPPHLPAPLPAPPPPPPGPQPPAPRRNAPRAARAARPNV